VGWWLESPWGEFADAMVERPDGHRVLLAPDDRVAELVSTTYTFDEVRVEPFVARPQQPTGRADITAGEGLDFSADPGPSGGPGSWGVRSPSLTLDLTVGPRTGLGRLLRLVPSAVAASPAFATLTDPVARLVLDGVRTRGTARAGRREYYGATDAHAVTAIEGALDGVPLGPLAPVDPPCRFGFSSTPRRPSVTHVVTTIDDAS
jgi:hypothetical protein